MSSLYGTFKRVYNYFRKIIVGDTELIADNINPNLTLNEDSWITAEVNDTNQMTVVVNNKVKTEYEKSKQLRVDSEFNLCQGDVVVAYANLKYIDENDDGTIIIKEAP